MARRMKLPIGKTVVGGMLTQPQNLRQLAQFGAATESIRLAIEDGDHQRGVQLIGQVQGLLDDIPTVNELFQRLLSEARATRDTLPN